MMHRGLRHTDSPSLHGATVPRTCTSCREALIAILEPVLRDEILKDFPAQSCMESCRILADLLDEAGLPSQPIAADTLVMNRAYARCCTHEGEPADWATVARWHQEHGAAFSRIGRMTTPDHWPGHLVLLTEGPEGAALWDPSINQADRPQDALRLPKLLVLTPVDPELFLAGTPVEASLPDGTVLTYTAQRDQRPRAAWWFVRDPRVATVTARIRERLGVLA